MTQKLIKVGDSWAVVINETTLAEAGISAETPLSVAADGGRLVIEPVDAERVGRFHSALDDVNERFGPALRKLAE
jgi:antitoxin component of MazEF toxin-antitoxin module